MSDQNKQSVLGTMQIRFRVGRTTHRARVIMDPTREFSQITADLAAKAGFEPAKDVTVNQHTLKCQGKLGDSWVDLRDSPDSEGVLVLWFTNHSETGNVFSQFVLEHTRRTTIVAVEEEEEEKEDGDGKSE